MNLQTYYQLALSKIPGIGPIRFKKIIEKEPDAEKLFFSSSKYLQKHVGLNESIATAILKFDCKKEIETELAFCEKNNIKILLQSDEHYPRHMCMMMRGIQKQNSSTTTSAFSGQFENNTTRSEFLRLISASLH